MTDLRGRSSRLLAAVVAVLVILQLVPYGRGHSNPPTTMEPDWISADARELTVRACYNCHSNETRWPWYSHVAPISWLVQSDVDRGRHELNFSEWDRPQREVKESAKVVQKDEMPQWYYALLHPEARLSSTERATLIQSYETMFGGGLGRGR